MGRLGAKAIETERLRQFLEDIHPGSLYDGKLVYADKGRREHEMVALDRSGWCCASGALCRLKTHTADP